MGTPENTLILKAVSIVAGCIAAIIIGELALHVYVSRIADSEYMTPGLVRYDQSLGWQLSKGWQGQHRHYDYDVTYQIDAFGFRYQQQKSIGSPTRLLVVGDSFTFGLGVEDNETFVARLNESDERAFINGGVPGYSPEQVLLWLPRARALSKTRDVLFVLYLGNDLVDLGLEYPVQAEFAKPAAHLGAAGELVLGNVPVPTTAKPESAKGQSLGDYILKSGSNGWLGSMKLSNLLREQGWLSGPSLDAHRISESLELFSALMVVLLAEQPGRVTLALLPGASLVNKPASISARYQAELAVRLKALGAQKGWSVLDLGGGLQNCDNCYFPFDGHLTATGHERVAEAIAAYYAREMMSK